MRLRAFLFISILTGLILAMGYYFGGNQGILVALVLSAVMNLGSYWFSDKIVLALYGGRPLPREEHPELHDIVHRLAGQMQIPEPKIYMVNLPAPNAFATGRNKRHAVVAVTPSILELLNGRELEGVLAHELSHIENRDILISSIAATLAGVISYLAHMAYFASMFAGGSNNNRRGNPLGALLLLIFTPIIATFLRLALSRSREYLADETGAKTIGDPEGLASALEKLGNFSKTHPIVAAPKYEATSHLFIVNPFKATSLLQLLSTHPPLAERVKRLRGMK